MSLTLEETLLQYLNINKDQPRIQNDVASNLKVYKRQSEDVTTYNSSDNDVKSLENDDQQKTYRYQCVSTISSLTVFSLIITILLASYLHSQQIYFTEFLDISKLRKKPRGLKSRKVKEYSQIQKTTTDFSSYDAFSDSPDDSKINPDNLKEQEQEMRTQRSPKPEIDIDEQITNFYDHTIKAFIDEGEKLFKDRKYEECTEFFQSLHKEFPKSARAVYGHAKCLEKVADKAKSEKLLFEAFKLYEATADIPSVPLELAKLALITMGERAINFGERKRAVKGYNKLGKLLPNDPEVLGKLGIAHLYIGEYYEALPIFSKILRLRPGGWAKVHIGYIFKALKNYTEAIQWLESGIASHEEGVEHGRFYFSLADCYYKMGRKEEAKRVYEDGAEKGLFLSTYQRSIYNSGEQLRAQPWWTAEESELKNEVKLLEQNFEVIRKEALALLKIKSGYLTVSPHLINYGNWKLHQMFVSSTKQKAACAKTPKICRLVHKLKHAAKHQRGQVYIGVLDPQTHVWPHTGPTNCRLRLHLAINAPKDVHIRVAEQMGTWQTGKTIIFDDSFEYEMWNNNTEHQMIYLSADFWHPDVPSWEIKSLSTI